MVPAFLISAIFGAAIGTRFKVQVLILSLFAATLVSPAATVALGQSGWSIIATTALTALGIQVGYLCGTFATCATQSGHSDGRTFHHPFHQSH